MPSTYRCFACSAGRRPCPPPSSPEPGDVIGPTRREILIAGAASAAALSGLAPAVAEADAGSAMLTVTERLQRLVQLELLLSFCYHHVLGSSLLTGRQRATLSPFLGHEQAHIAALERLVRSRGGTLPLGPPDAQAANRDVARRHVGGRLGP